MKFYLETLRRLMRAGLTLLVLVVIAELAVAMQICTARGYSAMPGIEVMFAPLVVFTYVGGIGLALVAFSFLNKRADSDFYHSLPIKRSRMFGVIALAAATWIGATVLLSVLAGTAVFLAAGEPFVPSYPLIAVAFYFVASMLAFAAASVASGLTGTLFSAAALTMIVLFLPRFAQFCVARCVVENAQIYSWLDLPFLLNPCWNIATGQIVMLSRQVYLPYMIRAQYILYSAALCLVELYLGSRIFTRRPSELAERGTLNAKLQTVFACLLVLPLPLVLVSGSLLIGKRIVVIVATAAFALYAVYQMIVLRDGKKMLRSLPWCLAPLALCVGLFFGAQALGAKIGTTTLDVSDVASVRLLGSDRGETHRSYANMQVAEISFTEDALVEYLTESLNGTAGSIRDNGTPYSYYGTENTVTTVEPVQFKLKNGRTVTRRIIVQNADLLKSLCEENEEYGDAIRALPPIESVRYWMANGTCYQMDASESVQMIRSYYGETEALGKVPYEAYRTFENGVTSYNYYNDAYARDDEQLFGSLAIIGYIGTQRYANSFSVQRSTPETAQMSMQMQNAAMEGDDPARMLALFTAVNDGDADWWTFDAQFTFFNVPLIDGTKATTSASAYCGNEVYGIDEASIAVRPYFEELIGILNRGTLTDDPNAFSVCATWSAISCDADGQPRYADMAGSKVSGYRTFEKTDVVRILELARLIRLTYQNIEMGGDTAIYNGMSDYAMPTPTPMPAVTP